MPYLISLFEHTEEPKNSNKVVRERLAKQVVRQVSGIKHLDIPENHETSELSRGSVWGFMENSDLGSDGVWGQFLVLLLKFELPTSSIEL